MDGPFLTSRWHWWEQANNTVIESHLSVTSGSSRARTQTARLTDRDANDCAISPPQLKSKADLEVWFTFLQEFNGTIPFPLLHYINSTGMYLYTDSSLTGHGIPLPLFS